MPRVLLMVTGNIKQPFFSTPRTYTLPTYYELHNAGKIINEVVYRPRRRRLWGTYWNRSDLPETKEIFTIRGTKLITSVVWENLVQITVTFDLWWYIYSGVCVCLEVASSMYMRVHVQPNPNCIAKAKSTCKAQLPTCSNLLDFASRG